MTRPGELVSAAGRRLASASEARTLLAHVLGVPVTRLLMVDAVAAGDRDAFEALVERREQGIPLQHLTGVAHFGDVSVAVGPGVFIPRPETEVLASRALAVLEGRPEPVVVELCAGSGALTRHLWTRRPDASFHAVELSDDAIGWLRRNLADTPTRVVHGDMADAFADLDGTVDLVVANPPYIPLESWAEVPAEVRDHDPYVALFSGDDGLDAMRVVADVAARLLRPSATVLAEHADQQGESAPAVFTRHGAWSRVVDHPDLNGRARFVEAIRAGRMIP